MTPEQKVALVRSAQDSYGLNQALAVTELPKSTWYYHRKRKVGYEKKHAYLLPILEKIAREHPEYGVPRVMAELRERYEVRVNHKVVERLLGLWDLSLLRNTHRPRPSGIQRAIAEAGGRANLVAQIASHYLEFVDEFGEALSNSHLDEIRNAANFVRKRIVQLPEHIAVLRHVRDCDQNMEYVCERVEEILSHRQESAQNDGRS